MDTSRRDLLAGAGGIVCTGAFAGCLDFTAGEGAAGPEGVPDTLSCADDEFVRLEPPIEEAVADRSAVADGVSVELSAEGTSETYGNSMRLAFRNAGEDDVRTYGEDAYTIQRETEEGWREIRGSTSGETVELPAEEESLSPNSAYNWNLTLREDAIAEAVSGLELTVCPALGPGPHRFVYWGLLDGPPVGVEFQLIG
ncbi:hypothetical protein [Halorubrum vacuolatum]|uniref:Uncharacterized protein n=1 Tax=Halorubrum vacuolatum TaxID=63740 RepID=A0A238WFW5_HALVU|nr:hypothetical protein [Halorubrum vacuolatum]SNR45465.1 hypothetical protein SAMN06264855_107123 [Halorubrum vacuolatum]